MAINNTTNVNTFYDSTMKWTQPGFQSSCSSPSGYSVWAGLGGWNYNNGLQRLLQDGTDVGSSLNGIFAWWEAWSSDDHTTEVAWNYRTINPGDALYADTYYMGGSLGVGFQVIDYTTGISWNAQPTSYDVIVSTTSTMPQLQTQLQKRLHLATPSANCGARLEHPYRTSPQTMLILNVGQLGDKPNRRTRRYSGHQLRRDPRLVRRMGEVLLKAAHRDSAWPVP